MEQTKIDDLEWRRKTYQHIMRLIRDEQLLLDVVLHPEIVENVLDGLKHKMNLYLVKC